MSVLERKTPASEKTPSASERSVRLSREEIFSLIGAVIFVGAVLLEYVEVPIDNRPNAPTTSLKVRLKCAVSDLLNGDNVENEDTVKDAPKTEDINEEPKQEPEENPPKKKPAHEEPEYRYAEGGKAFG
jgi:hypothetical protein